MSHSASSPRAREDAAATGCSRAPLRRASQSSRWSQVPLAQLSAVISSGKRDGELKKLSLTGVTCVRTSSQVFPRMQTVGKRRCSQSAAALNAGNSLSEPTLWSTTLCKDQFLWHIPRLNGVFLSNRVLRNTKRTRFLHRKEPVHALENLKVPLLQCVKQSGANKLNSETAARPW